MSSVIYARVPDALKEAVETYRVEQGTTLTRGLADLIQRGLESASRGDEPDLHHQLEKARGELREAQAHTQVLEQRVASTAETQRIVAQQMKQELGQCPKCGKPVRGEDVLITGRCSEGHPVRSLVEPAEKTEESFNRNEYLVLLGALGVLLGLALASKETQAFTL